MLGIKLLIRYGVHVRYGLLCISDKKVGTNVTFLIFIVFFSDDKVGTIVAFLIQLGP